MKKKNIFSFKLLNVGCTVVQWIALSSHNKKTLVWITATIVSMFSFCMSGFSPGSPTFSYSLKTCFIGELLSLNCPRCACEYVTQQQAWWHVQGVLHPLANSGWVVSSSPMMNGSQDLCASIIPFFDLMTHVKHLNIRCRNSAEQSNI